jgi:hypothetical protein
MNAIILLEKTKNEGTWNIALEIRKRINKISQRISERNIDADINEVEAIAKSMESRHTSFYSIYFIVFFRHCILLVQIEGLWQLYVYQVCWWHFPQQHTAHLVYRCHNLVTLTVFLTFSFLFYLLQWSVLNDFLMYSCDCLGVPRTTLKKEGTGYVFWLPHESAFPHLPPWSLRCRDNQIRPINNPTMASTCSTERESHTSVT